MKSISIIPPWPRLHGGNRVFDEIAGFAEWRRLASDRGFDLQTSDLIDPETAAVLWVVDIGDPGRILPLLHGRRVAGLPSVLQILESPFWRPHSWSRRLHAQFDAVLTYDPRPAGARYWHYRIPVALQGHDKDVPFSARRTAVMLNTNHLVGFWSRNRRPGGLRFVASLLGDLLRAPRRAREDLYAWRRRLARTAEVMAPEALDVGGRGWSGEPLSWFRHYPTTALRRIVEAPPHAIGQDAERAKSAFLGGYRFVIAAENYRGTRGYISEKIIHPMLAGSVPVYLGEEAITEVVPAAAFVDARQFRTHSQLITYLQGCPEGEWNAMRQAGRAWLASKSAATFSGQAFAEKATALLEALSP